MDTAKDRLLFFLRHIGLSQGKFEKSIGLSNGYINNVKSIGSDKLQLIMTEYPLLNVVWLISGKGNMLNDNNSETNKNKTKTVSFDEYRAGETSTKIIPNNPVSWEQYEELRNKYLTTLEDYMKLRDKYDEVTKEDLS